MKTEPNLNNFSNNASKFHKYSNYTLFSRRETEYSSRIKKKVQLILILHFKGLIQHQSKKYH